MAQDPQPLTLTSEELADARTRYGRGTAPWAGPGRLQVDGDRWLAFSLTPHVDYNLALLHGPAAAADATVVLEAVEEAGVPAVVMLAGAGLAAGGALDDAGWVCTGAMPFMARSTGPMCDDPDVRLLDAGELPAARALAAAAFGVPEEVGAVVFSDRAHSLPGTHVYGLFEEGELRCCSLSVWVEGAYSVGWALSTAPGHQRSGYGRRLMRASNFHRRTGGGPSRSLLTASPAGERLYREEGYVTLEHWQLWSRPRWVLP